MLVLTRRIEETLVIGEGSSKVDITVLGIKGNQVRIGIDAPREIAVHREEIYHIIQAKKLKQNWMMPEEEGEAS